jgi:hypothetical protein
MYAYKPIGGLWELLVYDFDYLGYDWDYDQDLYGFASHGVETPEVKRMMEWPPFQRAYLRGLKDAAEGPLQTAAYSAFIDQTTQALAANGVTDDPQTVKSYLAGRQAWISEEVLSHAAPSQSATTKAMTSPPAASA